ncbi:hypothetical protein N665_1036s0005, partial [Sinapis alba]
MTKKKKVKRGLPGKGTSASPSSSASTHSAGASNQNSDRSSANSSPIKLDLAAAIADGSVDLHTSDLQLEPRATVQIELNSSEITAKAVTSNMPISELARNNCAQDTPVSLPVKTASVAIPDLQTPPSASELLPATAVAPTAPKDTSAPTYKSVAAVTPTPATKPVDEWRRTKKSWESFVIGQFYSSPPAQNLIHNIINGIWSKQFRDITVSKLDGFSFLFRIPNAGVRNHVINQRLWQIEGQTMFVAHWEPGNLPEKPALTSAPIWLELRNVPLQFFNEDGLERIAGLVGQPKYLHPATANKSNVEVAKVLTIIDLRQPLPEAVNVQFDSGHICRVTVSSPWMPSVCSHCKEIGHSVKRCSSAPITCNKKAKRPRQPASPRGQAVIPPQEDPPNSTSAAQGLKLLSDKGKAIASSSSPPPALSKSRAQAVSPSRPVETCKASASATVSEVESDSSDSPVFDPD